MYGEVSRGMDADDRLGEADEGQPDAAAEANGGRRQPPVTISTDRMGDASEPANGNEANHGSGVTQPSSGASPVIEREPPSGRIIVGGGEKLIVPREDILSATELVDDNVPATTWPSTPSTRVGQQPFARPAVLSRARWSSQPPGNP